jgi:hypothetical protein
MGYNLKIGEAHVSVDFEERQAEIDVLGMSHSDAPINSVDVEGRRTNVIWPGYTVWYEFTKETSLYLVFFGNSKQEVGNLWTDDEGNEHDGLISNHPKAAPLTEAHYRAFKAALDRHKFKPNEKDGVDYNQRRLEWLTWWTRWALDNCKYPTFYNS